MAVVQIRLVLVLVDERFVAVHVGVRLRERHVMSMPVVLVVDVEMLVLERLVLVRMGMLLGSE